MTVFLDRIMKDGKALYLAYDQGLEHGPTDFNKINVDPEFVLKTASDYGYNAVVLHHGTAEHYYNPTVHKVPLIVKLNGKSKLIDGDPLSLQLCSVDRALRLGAAGVGYTIYPGSQHEEEMLVQLSKIVDEAHQYGLPVVVWTYPRGKAITDEFDTDILAYSARMAAELGADVIKIKYNNRLEEFKWVVKNACRAKIVISGGEKVPADQFLSTVSEFMQAGAAGIAVGRNVWQADDPGRLSEGLKEVILGQK